MCRTWTSLRAALAAAVMGCMAAGAMAQNAGDVVISQVWGGSTTTQTSTTLPNSDFIELFNRSSSAVTMNGWSLAFSTSSTGTAWTQFSLPTVTLQPGQYYLVRMFTTPATNGVALPAPDAVFGATTLPTTGKVALRTTTAVIGTVACPAADATLMDFVTYSTTTNTCGQGLAPGNSTTGSGLATVRKLAGCQDTDVAANDFETAVPSARNTASATNTCAVQITGACCNTTTGACTTTVGSTSCAGTYVGDNTTCSSNPCPEARRCCSGTTGTTCSLVTQSACLALVNGVWSANSASTCTSEPCGSAVSCCFPDGTCCSLTPDFCSARGGTSGAASSTCTSATNNCLLAQPAQANDTCATATALLVNVQRIGNNFTATGGDGLNTDCSTVQANKGVWFTFTPALSSTYDISSCGTIFDSVMAVWQIGSCTNTATWTSVACDDDGCPTQTTSGSFCGSTGSALAAYISNIPLTAGVTYHILLAVDSTSTTGGGNYAIRVTDTGIQPVGACCTTSTGVCWITTNAACTTVATPVGTYQGDGTVCSPSPCGDIGACCVGAGVCVLRTAANCTGTLVFQGAGTSCGPNPCITGSCCNNCTFACTVTLQENCAAATSSWTLDGVCSPNPCGIGAAPVNDEPTGAILLTLGTQVTGVNVNATDTNDGALSTCDTTVSRGMWYAFTPATTGYYQIGTCGSTHDTVLTLFAAGDTSTPIACDADTCAGGATDPSGCGTVSSSTLAARIDFVLLTAGTQYLIRVQSGGTTTFGTFVLVVNTTSAGACCANTTGACTVTAAASCSATTSTYQGDNSVCAPNPCPNAGSCCNPCTFACTTAVQTACAAGNVWTAGGVCSPNPCGGAAPANDTACGAVPLTLGATVASNNAGATSTDDGPADTCGTAGSKAVWYSFTPATSGDYTITTCGATFDSLLTVLVGDCASPSAMSVVACDDDACLGSTRDTVVCGTAAPSASAAIISSVAMTQGTTYYIRVAVDSATLIGGTFPITVKALATGSCCTSAGACTVVVSELCANANTYVPGTACGPTDCPPTGACCDPCGICTVTFATNCASPQVFQGNGTACAGVTCPGSTTTPPANDACANAEVITTFPYFTSGCSSGATGDGPIGTCQAFGAPPSLLFSVWYKFTATQPGTLTATVDFLTWRGNRLALIFSTPDGSCPVDNTQQVVCGTTDPYSPSVPVTPGRTYFIAIADEGTITTDEGGAYTLSVNFVGENGVCCRGATCAVVSQAQCTLSGPASGTQAVFRPTQTSCAGVANTFAGCCYADYDKNGSRTIDDIFIYLNGWFANSPYTKVGGDGVQTRTIDDIFLFLNAWFAGCN